VTTKSASAATAQAMNLSSLGGGDIPDSGEGGISDCRVYRKDHDVTLMLLSDSITGILFAIHEADRIGTNCHKLSISTTRSPYIH
jgi:hypothetical protein